MSRMPCLARTLLVAGLILAGAANAQTYSRTETIAYYDNTSKWVLGQTASVTCNVSVPASTACNGDVVSSTTFDTTYGLPLSTSAFGKLQQNLTYDTTSSVASGQRGSLKTVSDGRDTGTYNTTITFSGWTRGIPELITYPDGTTQSAQVNANGWIDSVTNEVGVTTAYTYDLMGRLKTINYPDETSPALTYNNTTITFVPVAATEYGIPTGHWRQIVATGNGRQVTYFDAMWRPLVEDRYDEGNVAATRSVTVKRYDAAGRLAFQSYPLASLTSYADSTLTGTDTLYDALGRVTYVKQDSELGILQTKMEYLTGFQTRVTNPRSQVTTTSYQAWDQPITDYPVSIDHPEGAKTIIVRDALGKPASVRRQNDANTYGITRTYAYNAYQELCRTVEPETDATLMGYDAAGNLAWSASGLLETTACDAEGDTAAILARKAVRQYDARNRVTALSFPDGNGDQTWDYWPAGQVKQITALNNGVQATNTYTYNKRGLLTAESSSQTGWYTWTLGYGFDANGQLLSQQYPSGLTIDFAPNALGQPTKAGAYATGVSYWPNGGVKQFTYGNGIVHTLAQNARGLPERSTDAYGTTKFLDDAYDYDGNGNVAAISDGATGRNQRGNRDMTYDGLDRLKTVVSPMYGTTGAAYDYDSVDNLTHVVAPGRNHYYCNDGHNRLTNIKTGSCSGTTVIGLGYDVQGNLDNKNGTAYAFDYGNRLRVVSGQESYRYDGLGRRVLAWSPTLGNILSQYGQGGQLQFQQNQRNGSRNLDYIYLSGSLVAIRTRNNSTGAYATEYQHTDALGSPVVVTASNRVVLERREYEPYGLQLTPTPVDGPGYTGHVYDAATGLNYMQQRYYDPLIGGHFLSVDPVTVDSVTGWNFCRYCYAANNPYKFKDPDGRIIDTVLDIAFIASDINDIRQDGLGWTNGAALVADVIGAAIPGATGLGAGVKGVAAVVGAVKVADKAKGEVKAAESAVKTLKESAAELIEKNGGKNRVEMRSPSVKVETDLAGKSHGGVDTPHTKVSKRNTSAPNQPAYNTRSATTEPSSAQDIRNARNYLESKDR